MKYSIIIPVHNRPAEVSELLESLSLQSRKDFEVVVVEDGSSITCKDVVSRFADVLPIRYFFKQNEGPGPTRNFGFKNSRGDFFVVFDSDCIVPPHYFQAVDQAIAEEKLDAWGGPDKPHHSFTHLQQAMGYTMSSVLTTGGIRGGRTRIGWFQPRSFNMGISRKVFEETGGFRFDRYAEDIEFSIRMRLKGYQVGLISQAYVFHKRRTNFKQFFTQVSNFGKGRAMIGNLYPDQVKLVHWFPTAFTVSIALFIFSPLVSRSLFLGGAIILFSYLTGILIDSLRVNRNVFVAILSVPSALIQLTGYGLGFLKQRVKTYFKK